MRTITIANKENQLVWVNHAKERQAVTDSRIVAREFHKRHDRVLRAIENLIKDINGGETDEKAEDFNARKIAAVKEQDLSQINRPKNGDVKTKNGDINARKIAAANSPHSRQYFYKSTYKDKKGESRPRYIMNREGFSLLIMSFTGRKALEWKIKFINLFKQYERIAREKATPAYIETRADNKIGRRLFTDIVKDLVMLSEQQGHITFSRFVYSQITSLINKAAGIDRQQRDDAPPAVLMRITELEGEAGDYIERQASLNVDGKAIYYGLKAHIIGYVKKFPQNAQNCHTGVFIGGGI